ncbi:MAG: 3',5'-cyclic-nucleotide phosphodiesterase [Syntrophorhabdaceae bacterium]|nr:3',5'-cyclic-nucleotide phosphodiesterase [Syntrophorhabdaceae bacterium]MDD4196252.1 3',5'-cyclic-nucleotide phosphodiesterase [Syntrophorhabdaceae bacterium]
MNIKILGCSGNHVGRYRSTCFLIDGSLLVDAGTITDSLRRKDLPRIKRILITHTHMDHLKGLFSFVDELAMMGGHRIELVSAGPVLDIITNNLTNNLIWPDFTAIPSAMDAIIKLRDIPLEKPSLLDGITVKPILMTHTVYTVGYVLRRNNGDGFMFTADTGPTERFWEVACNEKNIRFIMADVSFPDRLSDLALISGHMTPSILMETIDRYGLGDRIFYVTHIKPIFAREITRELLRPGRSDIRILRQAEMLEI